MTAELVDFVLEQTGRPLDRWAVAATLESGGVRDLDARERYGRRDVFDLADEVYARCLEAAPAVTASTPLPPRSRRAVAKHYIEGGFFFVPLMLQLGSLVLLGYGQWASLDFTHDQASVVGVALIGSFALTGAFAQTLGYLGPFFASPGRHLLVGRVVWRVVAVAVGALLAVIGIVWLVNLGVGSYPRGLLDAGLVYFGLAGLVSVLSAVLYMLKQYLGMLLGTVAGIGVVGLVLHHTAANIYVAHWAGLSTTVGIEATWAVVVISSRAAGTTADLRVAKLPSARVLLTLVAPYAAYGAMYYGLLFADRLAAWSAGTHDLPFTFRAQYEVALDWALISVVPALAMLEVVVHDFSARLIAAGRTRAASDAVLHNQELRAFYLRRLASVGLVLVVGAVLVFAAGHAVDRLEITKLHGMFGQHRTLVTYPIALTGYAFLVVALFSVLFLLTLGRPWLVLRSLWPAIVTAVAATLALSRLLPFWTAAGGLAAGTFVFALLATNNAWRVLGHVDFYYYAAY